MKLFFQIFCMIFVGTISLHHEIASSQEPVWKIENVGHTAYLLGATHMGRETRMPQNLLTREIIAKADLVAFEIDSRISSVNPKTKNQFKIKPIPKGVIKSLSEFLKLCQAPDAIIENRSAAFVLSVCERIALQNLGGDVKFSSEVKVMEFITELGTYPSFVFLETREDQINMLQSIDDNDWIEWAIQRYRHFTAAEIEQTLANALDFKSYTDCDRSRDLLMERLASPAIERLNKTLLDDRNLQMAARMHTEMLIHKTSIFVIGADHAFGRYGILEVLRTQGASIYRWHDDIQLWMLAEDHVDCKAP